MITRVGNLKIAKTINQQKENYFYNGARYEIVGKEEWKREYDLCECDTCFDGDCLCRNDKSRYPADIGGQDQCLRMMQHKSPLAWRNGDGTVIAIPRDLLDSYFEE